MSASETRTQSLSWTGRSPWTVQRWSSRNVWFLPELPFRLNPVWHGPGLAGGACNGRLAALKTPVASRRCRLEGKGGVENDLVRRRFSRCNAPETAAAFGFLGARAHCLGRFGRGRFGGGSTRSPHDGLPSVRTVTPVTESLKCGLLGKTGPTPDWQLRGNS